MSLSVFGAFPANKLESVKQEVAPHSKAILLEKDLTIDATTFSEPSLEHSNSKDHNQSLLDKEIPEVSLKGCLSETPTQIKVVEGLGGYIRALIGQLEGYCTIAQQIEEKTEQPKEIIAELDKQVNALGDWLKGQQAKEITIASVTPIMVNEHVDTPAQDFCLNDDFNYDDAHEEREDKRIVEQVLPTLNKPSHDDFFTHQYKKAAQYSIEGFRQDLESSQRTEKTYCPEDETSQAQTAQTTQTIKEFHEIPEATPIRKTSESVAYRATCLKKQDSNKSRESDSGKKTVSFTETPRTKDMDVRRYLLEEYRKDKKRVAKRHYGAGWD